MALNWEPNNLEWKVSWHDFVTFLVVIAIVIAVAYFTN